MEQQQKPILFFDGVCGLCNTSVDFLISIDKHNKLLFAPLQGEMASKVLAKEFIEDLNSMAFHTDGKTFSKSTAVLKALQNIGGIWSIFSVFLIIPPFIRNSIYSFVANNRYKWFGKPETCRMPTADERAKILM